MNFEFSDDQQAIKRAAHEFLADNYRPETVRALATGESGITAERWSAISDLGWPAVVVDERYGGLGLGVVELTVIQEELGYVLAPTPLHSTVVAALLIQELGSEQQKRRLLPELASGERRGAVALWDWDGGWSTDGVIADPRSGELSGTKVAVADADGAELLVVAGADDAHFLVERGAGVQVDRRRSLDPTRRLHEVVLSGAAAERLGDGDGAAAQRAYAIAAVALAAECVGIAQRTMEMAVGYARDRKQFGRPIGSFQAISHRCAQMLLETEGARSMTYGAAWALDHDPETAIRAASMAKAYAGDAGYRVAASALQVHGGIGFTWEHDLHFFLKRAKANAFAYGDSRWHRERVLTLVGL